MQLFHGTRQRFDKFDVAYKGTGESGNIAASWFTDNFKGASNHALLKNRNPGLPLVYRCELKAGAIIANHRQPLTEQPEIVDRFKSGLPVDIEFGNGLNRFVLKKPCYTKYKGKMVYSGHTPVETDELIRLYLTCGIQGVYDWEGEFTDSYLHGTTTVIFEALLQIVGGDKLIIPFC
ncbi:hypothetical protein ACNQ05_23915 [Enterobacter cloacae complex sp.6701062]|nr:MULTISPECIES: hypothetical protein [Enterobacteriaceae]MDU2776125.1 hypothetical protein [Klebsiella grimontii]CAE6399546.1 hypothetical protein AI2716V1_4656 [Enterobacter cloacae]KDF51446.1 hypothetical protein AF39_04677 [Enterobacter hormaechei]KJL70568.1 hypothetical protein SS38_13870 [Enterobacter hormaechei subsp. xiangfangensis]MBB6668949.1 hypothetical protein [Klebsiella pneumoniae]